MDRAVDPRKKKKNINIQTYTYTKNAHWCYISPARGVAISQLIAMKFGTRVELTYVINFAEFGVDQSQGWGLMSIKYAFTLLPLLEKSSLTPPCTDAHAVIFIC